MRIVLDAFLLLLRLFFLAISLFFRGCLLHWGTFSILHSLGGCWCCICGLLILCVLSFATFGSVTPMLSRVIPYLFFQCLIALFHLLEASLCLLSAPVLVRVHLLCKLAIGNVQLLLSGKLRYAEVFVVVLLRERLPFCSNSLVGSGVLQQTLTDLMHQATHLNVRELVHELGHMFLIRLQQRGYSGLTKDLLTPVTANDHSPSLPGLRMDLSCDHHAASIVVGHRLPCQVWQRL
mmetsp:Transcript_26777/g.49202  ORF Transcript_26777/g.49202 Transcript_26777/m.49202 type:complete len:235 (-) Transcript_26777:1411-2115(-)